MVDYDKDEPVQLEFLTDSRLKDDSSEILIVNENICLYD